MPALKRTTSQTEALIQAQVVLLENEIISRSDNPDKFRLINNQYNRLQSWHDLHTGWRIYRTPASIRLIRTPVSLVPGYIFRNLRQPRDFACFVWTLWYAENRLNDTGGHANAQQFLMSQLAERLEEHSATGYLAPHAVPFDFRRQTDRYSLFHALKALEELGGLHLQDGSSEEWVNQSGQENALYEFTEVARSLILALDTEQVRATGKMLQGNPHSLAPVRLPGAERILPLQRAWRTLLLGPALLKYDDPEAFAAVREHEATLQFEIGETYGWQLDLRHEYAMIIRPSGTGLGSNGPLNLNGAADQAALLCCQLIRQKVVGEWHYPLNDGCMFIPESEIAEIFRQVREKDGSRWGSTARKTSFQELLGDVYAKLRLAGLMRGPDRDGRVLILPTLARFSVSYPPDEEVVPVPVVVAPPQQLSFAENAASPDLSGKKNTTTPTGAIAAPQTTNFQEPLTPGRAASYNTPQAARLLGVTQQSVSRWLSVGFIEGKKSEDGRGWLIPLAEIERVRTLRQGTATPVSVQTNGVSIPSKIEKLLPTIKSGPVEPTTSKEQGYTPKQAGELLGVVQQSVSRWLNNGFIKGEQKGRNWSIPSTEIERVRSLRQNGATPAPDQPGATRTSTEVEKLVIAGSLNKSGSNPSQTQGYNTYQAARVLGVTDSTILNWLRKGKISGEKTGSNWSIPLAEIERVKESNQAVLKTAPIATTRNVPTQPDRPLPPARSGPILVFGNVRETSPTPKAITQESKPAPAARVSRQELGNNRAQGFKIAEAAELLGVSDQTILNWLKKGKIRGERIGLSWSIPADEIERVEELRRNENELLTIATRPTLIPVSDNAEQSLLRGTTTWSVAAESNRERSYTAKEAGELLGVSDQTILNWLKKGSIRGKKSGTSWSIPATEVGRIKRLQTDLRVE